MLTLLVFFSVYFTAPIDNVDIFYEAKCENQKTYTLYSSSRDSVTTIKEGENIVFTGVIPDSSDDNFIKSFYCFNNHLYTIIPETDLNGFFNKLALYKLDGESFIKLSFIDNVIAFYSIISENKLIYYDFSDHYFYKLIFDENLDNKEQLIEVSDYNLKEIFYISDTDEIVYIGNDNFINFNNDAIGIENLISVYDVFNFNSNWYFLYVDGSSNSLSIIDREGISYFNYDLGNDETMVKGLLFANEYGIFSYLLMRNSNVFTLKLIYIPEYNKNNLQTKIVDTDISNIYGERKKIYYLKNNDSNTEVFLVKGSASKPLPPIVDLSMVGILNEIPSGFSFSNFNEDPLYFLSYELDISGNKNFTSIDYSDIKTYYNENSSSQIYQFDNNFLFERDKPYYLRIKYNGLLIDSIYSYIRFIITNLGEITSFKILNKLSDSSIFTNTEMVKVVLENTGNIEKIQLSQNEDFKDNNEDIPAINFENEFSFILPEEEKEYTYFVRPVVFDNENLMGAHQIKTAKIILDKTPPVNPVFITNDNSEFVKDNIRIEWNKSSDNLSGIKLYKIKLMDALNNEIENISFENDRTVYIPQAKELDNGVYSILLSVCDNALNCSLETKLNFMVVDEENHKPYKPSLIRPSNKDIIDTMPFSVSWNKSNDPDNDDFTYSLIIAKDINFNSKVLEFYLITKLSQNIAYLSEGHYYLKLFAVDTKGLQSDLEIIEFDIINPNKGSNSSSSCSFY